MAALVCDICGGKLIMGSGGIAVCDSCGMEHSQDRIKEKVQEIKGTVQVDNSHMIDTWMKMGKSAAEAGNNKEAYDYFTKVVELEPENWRAIFEKGKAAAWQSTLINLRTSELYQAVKMSLAIIENLNMTIEEQADIKNEFAVAIYNVNNAILNLKKENFNSSDDKYFDLHWDEWWELHYTYALDNIAQTEDVITVIEDLEDDLSKSNVLEMKKHICETLRFVCSCEDTYWDSYEQNCLLCFGMDANTKKDFVNKYIKLVNEIREIEPNFATEKYQQIDPFDPPQTWNSNRYDILLRHWQSKERELKAQRENEAAKKRFEEYWKEHADEKKQLEGRISAIDDEIRQLKSNLSPYESRIKEIEKEKKSQVPAENELKSTNDKIADLQSQKKALGLFQGKQKKALQEQIDKLTADINNVQNTVKLQRDELHKDVDSRIDSIKAEMKPYTDKIAELESEKINIINELKKPR